MLRFHFWPEGVSELDDRSGLHDHMFGFTSLVLGKADMINTDYTIRKDPRSQLALYEVNYISAKEMEVRKLGDHFAGVVSEERIISPDSYYTMNTGVRRSKACSIFSDRSRSAPCAPIQT